MKIKLEKSLFFVLVSTLLFWGCSQSSSDTSSKTLSEIPSAPVANGPDRLISSGKQKDTVHRPEGTEKDFTHHLWTLAIKENSLVVIESFAWCEVANVPKNINLDQLEEENRFDQYCIGHEVAKVTYGDKTAYVNRSYNRFAHGADRFVSNIQSANTSSLWQTDDLEWKKKTVVRDAVPVKQFDVEAPLQEYRLYISERHRLLTDRCRRMPDWQETRKQTPARQGNFAFYSKTMFALNTVEENQMTAIELDPENFELKFVSTFGGPGFEFILNQFTDNYPNYQTAIWELNAYRELDKLDHLQVLKPRNDAQVQLFGMACDIGYRAFAGMDIPAAGCPSVWQDLVPLRTESIETKLDPQEFSKILTKLRGSPALRKERRFQAVRSGLMDLIPYSGSEAHFPRACFQPTAIPEDWARSERKSKESK